MVNDQDFIDCVIDPVDVRLSYRLMFAVTEYELPASWPKIEPRKKG